MPDPPVFRFRAIPPAAMQHLTEYPTVSPNAPIVLYDGPVFDGPFTIRVVQGPDEERRPPRPERGRVRLPIPDEYEISGIFATAEGLEVECYRTVYAHRDIDHTDLLTYLIPWTSLAIAQAAATAEPEGA